MISTKQLRYFDAVARLGHFGRAAEHCAVTQPALSMQIGILERQLGVELVERRSKGIGLTEVGREIARRASKILVELRDISDYAANCKAPLSVPIRLGVIPTVAPYMLPRLLLSLREHHPDLALHIRETRTHSLMAELVAGSLDLLVLALPVEHPDIETTELRADRFLLAVPPGRTFGSGVLISPDLIRNDRLLLLEEGHCLRDQALAVCNLRASDSTDTLGASSLSTVVQMVISGLGLTLLPEISIAHETAHGDVTLIRFAEPEPQRLLGLAWRKTSPRQRDFVELGSLIKEALTSQNGK
jgi:LysR family transcriptional regulator, hydrogen peroxide-inducible genes activator